MSTKTTYITVFISILFAALMTNVVFEIRSTVFVGVFTGVALFIFLAAVEFSKMKAMYRLPNKFKKLGQLSGLSLDEIVEAVGSYTSHQNVKITDRGNAPGHFYVWKNDYYYIKLLFDEYNICIGISEEKMLKK